MEPYIKAYSDKYDSILDRFSRKTLYITGEDSRVPSTDDVFIEGIGVKEKTNFYFTTGIKNKYLRLPVKAFRGFLSALKLPKTKDLYIVQNGLVPVIFARIFHIINGKIVLYVNTGIPFDYINKDLNPFTMFALKKVDGFICVSDMNKELLKKAFPNKPSMSFYLPNFNKLKMAHRPALNTHNILVISTLTDNAGYFPKKAYYKGIDLVIDGFLKLKQKVPDAKIYIIGRYNETILAKFKLNKDINFLGFVPNLKKIAEKCSVYVHMGRGDASPMSVVDAMSLGLPAIISEYTGTKAVAEVVDNRMIVPLDSTQLCDRLVWYFSLKPAIKLSMSNKAIKASKVHDLNFTMPKFRMNYIKLLKELKLIRI